jgi:hypothetical protein
MPAPRNAIQRLVRSLLGDLRFPQLFLVTLALFLVDLVIPDLIPFLDEILLGLASLLFASWKRPPTGGAGKGTDGTSGPVIDVEPDP